MKKITASLERLDTAGLKKNKAQVKKEGSSKLVLSTKALGLDLSAIANQPMLVINHLQKHGFKAYLVGGCIRDLILGKKPKDFDVSTNATPEQVHRLFTNSRIIGRRFKIVHVVYGREIIEVTTFRSNKEAPKFLQGKTRVSAESGMLIRDNVYGKSIVEDSQRRDFTINALYLDPIKKEVYDFNGGIYDIQQGVIDIIGDSETRYSEDPVRMIRALRFSAKLDFKISKRSSDPIKKLGNKLLEVSNARMFEEVNKLFLTGHGLESFRVLRKYKFFELLFPNSEELLDNQNYINFVEHALINSDKRYAEDKRNMPHFLYAVIMWTIFQRDLFLLNQRTNSMVSPISQAELVKCILNDVLDTQERVTALPMAVSDSIKALWRMQLTLNEIDDIKNIEEITSRNIFRASYDFFVLRSKFEPYLAQAVKFWEGYYEKSKALAEKRKFQNQEKFALLKSKKKFKKEAPKENVKKTPAKESFADEKNISAKRKEQLKKAKAWRAAMKLDI